ncbi:MAG: FeoA family protein [Pseudomonadota bacterium]
MQLHELAKGQVAKIISVKGDDPILEAKLREIGFAEDDIVEMIEHGPLGKTPLCIRLNQTLVALRLAETKGVVVEPMSDE